MSSLPFSINFGPVNSRAVDIKLDDCSIFVWVYLCEFDFSQLPYSVKNSILGSRLEEAPTMQRFNTRSTQLAFASVLAS